MLYKKKKIAQMMDWLTYTFINQLWLMSVCVVTEDTNGFHNTRIKLSYDSRKTQMKLKADGCLHRIKGAKHTPPCIKLMYNIWFLLINNVPLLPNSFMW